jgi:glycosyltransferase involved in cell wall biosynthesis
VGRDTPTLKRFVKDMEARCPGIRIECPGFVHYANIPRQLKGATLGIVPYEASEGTHCAFVAKAVEYLGCGLPVVSTPLENLRRHFATEHAIRFSGFDGRSFGNHILYWLSMPTAQRVEMGLKASRKVAAELDWSVIARNAVDFAERVHQHPPAPMVRRKR